MADQHIVELFNWSAVTTADRKEVCLRGTVMNHPRLADFTHLEHTSPLKVIYHKGGRFVAVTKNGTHYRLGVTDAGWLERHPNGRRDIINHFHLDVNLAAVDGESAYGQLA